MTRPFVDLTGDLDPTETFKQGRAMTAVTLPLNERGSFEPSSSRSSAALQQMQVI